MDVAVKLGQGGDGGVVAVARLAIAAGLLEMSRASGQTQDTLANGR